MTGNRIKRFTSEMRADGYSPAFDPVEAANVDGRLIIIDGHHRAAAAIKAGINEIPVRVVPVTADRAAQLAADAAEAAAQRGLRGR